jgi:hypothetical protein
MREKERESWDVITRGSTGQQWHIGRCGHGEYIPNRQPRYGAGQEGKTGSERRGHGEHYPVGAFVSRGQMARVVPSSSQCHGERNKPHARCGHDLYGPTDLDALPEAEFIPAPENYPCPLTAAARSHTQGSEAFLTYITSPQY